MLQAIWSDKQADIRELIVQAESTTAAHAVVVGRPDPGQVQDRYQIDETLTVADYCVFRRNLVGNGFAES